MTINYGNTNFSAADFINKNGGILPPYQIVALPFGGFDKSSWTTTISAGPAPSGYIRNDRPYIVNGVDLGLSEKPYSIETGEQREDRRKIGLRAPYDTRIITYKPFISFFVYYTTNLPVLRIIQPVGDRNGYSYQWGKSALPVYYSMAQIFPFIEREDIYLVVLAFKVTFALVKRVFDPGKPTVYEVKAELYHMQFSDNCYNPNLVNEYFVDQAGNWINPENPDVPIDPSDIEDITPIGPLLGNMI